MDNGAGQRFIRREKRSIIRGTVPAAQARQTLAPARVERLAFLLSDLASGTLAPARVERLVTRAVFLGGSDPGPSARGTPRPPAPNANRFPLMKDAD